MERIAIIPARGGSKRIPSKNIKNFNGKPIIAYSIVAALESNCFQRVIVSTDNDEIAKIASIYGAEIPFLRSCENSDDYSSLHDVIVECVKKLKIENTSIPITVILPTAPFVTPDLIHNFFNTTRDEVFDSAITVVPYEVNPQKALEVDDDGFLVKKNIIKSQQRSQDLDDFYHDAGQLYGFFSDEVVLRETLTGEKCKPVIIDKLRAQDIDDLYDWQIAEIKYDLLMKQIMKQND